MNILVFGDDPAQVRKKTADLKARFLQVNPGGEVIILYADDLPGIGSLTDMLTTVSLTGDKKCIIFKNLLSTKLEQQEQIEELLKQSDQEMTTLVFSEENSDVLKKTFVKKMTKEGILLEKYIFSCQKARVLRLDLVLGQEEKNYLNQLYQSDPEMVEREIEKIALLQRAGKSELIPEVFSDYEFSLSVFRFTDALFAKNYSQASVYLRQLFDQDHNEHMLLSMIINHVKKILFILDAENKKHDVSKVIKEMKIHPFVAKNLLQQKQRFSLSEVKSWLARLLEIDLLSKQGKVNAKLALEQFCVSIGTRKINN